MLKENNFRTGDLVQLKTKQVQQRNPFQVPTPSIYRIAYLDRDEVRLLWEINSYTLADLKPIPINGKDDSRIRLRIDRNAPFVMEGMNNSQTEEGLCYYLDQIKQLGWDSLLREIEEQRINYVHQVQRYLATHFNNSLLICE